MKKLDKVEYTKKEEKLKYKIKMILVNSNPTRSIDGQIRELVKLIKENLT